MNNKKFMKQSADSMSVSELAEAIKIKSVLRTNEEEVKVGDTVEVVLSYQDGRDRDNIEGKTAELIEIRQKKYKYRVKFENGNESEAYKVKKVTEKPKAEWIDITKECEFKPEVSCDGYQLRVLHKEKKIGFSGDYSMHKDESVIRISSGYEDKYKIEYSSFRNFKILKEVSK